MFKKDYRRVNGGPSEGKVEAQNMIRAVLIEGEKRFSDLLVETGLSRPALSSNLKELEEKREIGARVGSSDFREKYYFLTGNGINAYKRQKDIEKLSLFKYFPCSVGKLMQMLGVSFRDLAYVYGHAIDYAYPDDVIPPIKKEAQNIIEKCVTFSFYFEEDLSDGENPYKVFRQTLKEYAQVATSLASSQRVDVEHLNRLRNLLFVFKLDRDKLIDEYLKRGKKNQH